MEANFILEKLFNKVELHKSNLEKLYAEFATT